MGTTGMTFRGELVHTVTELYRTNEFAAAAAAAVGLLVGPTCPEHDLLTAYWAVSKRKFGSDVDHNVLDNASRSAEQNGDFLAYVMLRVEYHLVGRQSVAQLGFLEAMKAGLSQRATKFKATAEIAAKAERHLDTEIAELTIRLGITPTKN